MKIVWKGLPNRMRVVPGTDYRFEQTNGFTQDVAEPDLIRDLLTDGLFDVASDDPMYLLAFGGVAELSMIGVVTPKDLACMTDAQIDQLVTEYKVPLEHAGYWRELAQAMTNPRKVKTRKPSGEREESDQPVAEEWPAEEE